MFEKIEALDKTKHQDLRLNSATTFEFAKKLTVSPLGASEIVAASRFYPIIFPAKDGLLPQALFSMRKDLNSYVSKDGKWMVPYVPANIRRYPFILAPTEDPKKKDKSEDLKFVICIDREADHFASGEGEALLTSEGEATEVTTKTAEFLQKFQFDLQKAEDFGKLLEDNDCMILREIKTEIDGESKSLGSFRIADAKKINDLDDKILAEWVRNGILGMVYAQINSLQNFDRFNLKPATQPENTQ